MSRRILTTVVLLAVIAPTAAAHADSRIVPETGPRVSRLALAAVDVALIGDAVTTTWAVTHGAAEGNPVWGWAQNKPALLVLGQSVEKILIHELVRRNRTHPTRVAWWIAGIRGGMVAWNVYQIKKAQGR